MTKFFDLPFATAGDKTPIPNLAQMDGSVSYQMGFTSDYQLPYPTNPNSKAVPRYGFNELMYDTTKAIQQYQTYGFFDYQVGWTYDILAIVRYDPGSGINLYQSLVASNNALPTDATKWKIFETTPATVLQYARAVNAGVQVVIASPAHIHIDTATSDPYSIVTGAPAYALKPTVAGGYRLGGYVTIDPLVELKSFALLLYKNGVSYSELDFVFARNTAIGEGVVLGGSDIVSANGTSDQFELYLIYSGAAGITIPANSCYFNIGAV